MKGGKEVSGAPVVSGCDSPEVFEFVEEAFDPVTQLIGDGIVRDEDLADTLEGITVCAPAIAMIARNALLS